MAAVLIIGATIGGTKELDRAFTRRADYLDLAHRADWTGERARSNAAACRDQAAALRKWVADGAKGVPPVVLTGNAASTHPPYVPFDAKGAEEFGRDPEKVLALAGRCAQWAERDFGIAEERAREKRVFERNASFPWVLVASDPPGPK
jgi:hypothetical protein